MPCSVLAMVHEVLNTSLFIPCNMQGRSVFFFFCVPNYVSGVHLLGEIFEYVTVYFNPTIGVVFMGGVCWVCFCCQHSPISGMNVRFFWVRATECKCAQTRPWSILWSERVFREWCHTHVNSKGKILSTRRLKGRLHYSGPYVSSKCWVMRAVHRKKTKNNWRLICLTAIAHIKVMRAVHRKKKKNWCLICLTAIAHIKVIQAVHRKKTKKQLTSNLPHCNCPY